ncbi:MAG TPA: 50S ribosomal protein L23 [Gammaproteobacteria bacterium]|nr:50S ribosomal protein L23 [Gammaproteobacteria bacterium]
MSKESLMKVLLAPHVSEKAAIAADENRQFVFKVLPEANKSEIKEAVELLFEVKVDGVQVSNVKGKQKRFGQIQGRRASWKKAYVTLQEGHDIEFMGPQ